MFLSAHRSLLNGAEPREPAAWLATIARNECWARISARLREPVASDESESIPGSRDPLAEAIRSADLATLWRAIRELPRTQRDALLLRELGGLRYDELAVALAVTEPAVESLLVRARSRVRAKLQTVYGSLAPALRFLVSSGTPAVAAKAAALGLGAAAVTGGVAPQMLTRHHMQPPPARRAPAHALKARRHHTPAPVVHTVAAFVPAPTPVVPTPTTRPVTTTRRHEVEHEVEHEDPVTTTNREQIESSDDGADHQRGNDGVSGDSGSSDDGSGGDGGD